MTTSLPGISLLQIGVLSIQTIGEPEMIGFTTIDLEDRWFCSKWKKLGSTSKPIERRELYKDAFQPQGTIEMWLDMLDQAEAGKIEHQPYEIKNLERRAMQFELRAVIWNTEGIKLRNHTTTNQFVVCEFGGKRKETDQHKSIPNGKKGQFNWRFVFKVEFPLKKDRFALKFQVWDAGVVSNDAIAEGVLPLETMFSTVYDSNLGKKPADMTRERFPDTESTPADVDGEMKDNDGTKFPFKLLELYHPNLGEGKKKIRAKVQVSIEVMRLEYARKHPLGRDRTGDSMLPECLTRPPEPANPIFYPDKCAYYISWHCNQFCTLHKAKICCCFCLLFLVILIPVLFYMSQMPGLKNIIPGN